MNIKTKAIIASTLLTALFAGTSAIADGDDYKFFYENTVSTDTHTLEAAENGASGRTTGRVNYLTHSADHSIETDDKTGYSFEDISR